MSDRGPSSGRGRGRGSLLERALKGKAKATAIDLTADAISVSSGSDEGEDEFEEVEIPSAPGTPGSHAEDDIGDVEGGYLDDDGEEEEEEEQVIRLEIGGETEEQKAKRIALAMRKKPLTAKDRAVRLEIHKMHVITLLASARIRNKWSTNQLLQCRLLSLLPHALQAAFVIPPKRFPDRAQRSRLFFEALQALVTWWTQDFFDISDPTLGMRTRTWDEVQEVIDKLPRLTRQDLMAAPARPPRPVEVTPKGKGKGKPYENPTMAKLEEQFGGERLRTVNSLMKKALQQEGSRDVSAQLFVALARACGLGARLVVSLQPVPWRAEKTPTRKPKRSGAGSGRRERHLRQGMGSDPGSEADDMEEVPIPESPAGKKNNPDLYKLRKQRPAPQTVGKSKPKKKDDMLAQPPVYWAEVFSRSDQRWIPVDPVLGTIRKKAKFDPPSDNGPVRMTYVVAFEEDGYARDVTLRYTKNFGAKTSKLRPPPPKDGGPDWWSTITEFLQRPVRLNRDDLEDAELEMSSVSEGMPLHMSGFKDHPIYVLERHLKREEVILPKKEIGRFKGEAVYRRANVLQCRTSENWMRVGRQVKIGQEPLKWVKQRAVTLMKRRAQELAVQEGQEPVMQGLYAERQTELYIPPPIVDGRIPQNAFGNIDLYVPSMLPAGAVHLPYKGITKVAKQLGISYAEAVTSFEFKKQRAIPVITGIVVAQENEDLVMDAYWKSTAAAEERDKVRREEAALKRWVKLVNGLRVRRRLQAEYGTGEGEDEDSRNPMADAPKTAASIIASANVMGQGAWEERARERLPTPEVKEEVEDEQLVDMEPEALPAPEVAEAPKGRPKRVILKIPTPALSTAPPSPPTEPPSRPKRAAKAKANGSASTQTRGRAPTKAKGRKRKASESEDEAEDSDSDVPVRNGRAAPVAAAGARVTRSRAATTDEQRRKEQEKRERMRAALGSDGEGE